MAWAPRAETNMTAPGVQAVGIEASIRQAYRTPRFKHAWSVERALWSL